MPKLALKIKQKIIKKSKKTDGGYNIMRYNKMFLTFSIIMMFLACGLAQATPTINSVKINGDTEVSGSSLIVERGDTIDITVRVLANQSEKNVEVEAYIDGYEYSDHEPVSDSSEVFDMDKNDARSVNLQIKIPLKAEKDHYDLKIRVGGRTGSDGFATYSLNLKGKKHEVLIKDILMNDEVFAGRGLFTNIKVQNIGQKTENDITINVGIPELNIEEFTTIDELEADDSTTSEDVVLFIDECVKPGKYDVIAEIRYNEYDKVSLTRTITVKSSDGICQKTAPGAQKTLISVPGRQEASAGQSAIYPIMLTNTGNTPQTYVISVSRAVEAFGTARIDPSNVLILQPNKAETVFVYITVTDNAAIGQKDFTVTVASGAEKQDIPLSLNITQGKNTSTVDLKKILEISLIVLMVVLVIAGLIIGFNKLKPKEKETENESEELGTKTYY